jgi:hypothetical protein
MKPFATFGSGVLWAIPTLDLAGEVIVNPTPVPFGILQDVGIDFSKTLKELHGQYEYPVEIAGGTAKMTFKAKVGKFTAALFNLAFGATPVAGEVKTMVEEDGVVPHDTAYTITVSKGADFLLDLGVMNGNTGELLKRVSAVAAAGQYSVAEATGVYTFHSGDKDLPVKISYAYTDDASTGQMLELENRILGETPYFEAVISLRHRGRQFNLQLYQCASSKLTLATKLEDFTIPEFDFSAMANDANKLGKLSLAG